MIGTIATQTCIFKRTVLVKCSALKESRVFCLRVGALCAAFCAGQSVRCTFYLLHAYASHFIRIRLFHVCIVREFMSHGRGLYFRMYGVDLRTVL